MHRAAENGETQIRHIRPDETDAHDALFRRTQTKDSDECGRNSICPFGRRESRHLVDLSKPFKFVATTIQPLDKTGEGCLCAAPQTSENIRPTSKHLDTGQGRSAGKFSE